MMKHLKQLNGIRGLLPYLKTKRPTVLLIFFLSVIDAGLSLLPIQIIAAVVDLLSTGHSVFSPILGTSLTLHLVFFGAVYAAKHALSLIYGYTNTMLSTGIIESLRDDAMTWALESYKPYKEERREGDIVSRISGDVEAVVRAVAGQCAALTSSTAWRTTGRSVPRKPVPRNGLLPMVLKMIGSVVMMFVWSPVLGAISLALVLPLYAASKRVAVKSKEIAAELASRGIQMLDAPVSGGEPKAIDGTLSFMVGGEEEVFNTFKPVLLAMGSSAVLCGGIGAGNTTKLANQIIVAANIQAVAEALTLAQKAGVDPDLVFQAIKGGLAGSTVMNAKAPMMIEGNDKPGFKIDLHIKDLNNALDCAHTVGAPVPMTAEVQEILQWLHSNGKGQADHSAISQYYEHLTGIKLGRDL